MNKKYVMFAFLFMVLAVSISCVVFASDSSNGEEYHYDIEIITGVNINDIASAIDDVIIEKKNLGNNEVFYVSDYDLSKAYVVKQMIYQDMISEHLRGFSFEEMAAEKSCLMVPIISGSGREGFMSFECDKGKIEYTGMSVATEEGPVGGPDISRVMEICSDNDIKVDKIVLYLNYLYNMYLAVVDTSAERYVMVFHELEGVINEYTLYSEDVFFEMMDMIYDEDAIIPDTYGGGVPLRTTPRSANYSTKNSNEKTAVWNQTSLSDVGDDQTAITEINVGIPSVMLVLGVVGLVVSIYMLRKSSKISMDGSL